MRVPTQQLSFVPVWATGPWLACTLAAVCYLNVLPNQFVRDDEYLIRLNPRITSLLNFREIWLTNWWQVAGDPGGTPAPAPDRLYRPLVMFSFALNYAVGGLAPAGYLAVNIALHVLMTALLWRLADRLIGDRRVAAVAAGVFAVHPIHVEAIANVVGRADILAAIFLTGGVLWLRPPQGGALGGRRMAFAAGCFLLAFLCKESAACYPVLAAVGLRNRGDSPPAMPRARRVAGITALLAAPILVYLPLRYVALDGVLTHPGVAERMVNPLVEARGVERLIGICQIAGLAARGLLLPIWQSSDYGLAVVDPFAGWTPTAALGAACLILLVIGALGILRGDGMRRITGEWCLLLMGSYALVSNAVVLVGTSLGERLLYLPSAAFCGAIAVLGAAATRALASRFEGVTTRGVVAALAAVILLMAVQTVRRSGDWRDGATLARRDVANWPRSAQLHALAAYYAGAAADRLPPGDPAATAARRLAQEHLQTSLQICPDNLTATKLLAEVLMRSNDLSGATRLLRSVVARRPEEWQAHANLAMLLADQDPAAALAHAERAHEINPRSLQTRLNLAESLISVGHWRRAADLMRAALADLPAGDALRDPLRRRLAEIERGTGG